MSGKIAQTTTITPRDVLLYIPNLIGYTRVLFSVASLLIMSLAPSFWLLAIGLYVTSFVADLFDGWAARKFNQCSEFGGLLDMITDRCSTAGLLHVLSFEYNEYVTFPLFRVLFMGLILLDISSHWCQMYASTRLKLHHKSSNSNADRFFLVRWYYGYYYFFGYLCVGAEFTYIILYALAHAKEIYVLECALLVFVPGCAMKQVVNVFQLGSACYAVAAHDAKKSKTT